MYYILNETNQIIAADDTLLSLCGVTHINTLISKVIKEELNLDFTSNDYLHLSEEKFLITKKPLSTLLGDLTLVKLSPVTDRTNISNASIEHEKHSVSDETTLQETLDIEEDNELITLASDAQTTTDIEVSDLNISLEEDAKEDNVKDDNSTASHDLNDSLDITFNNDILFEDLANDSIENNTSTNDTQNTETTSHDFSLENDILFDDNFQSSKIDTIEINIEELSHKIGISPEDYQIFLNEFIDTALNLEKDLQVKEKQAAAIETLSYLGDTLHIPHIREVLQSIATNDNTQQRDAVESFYTMLSSITTMHHLTEQKESTDTYFHQEEEPLELFMQEEEKQTSPIDSENSFGTINLEDVTAKHFDFQLEEAADDLSLPVELIEEFVHDFIEQAHIETKKMLEAYEKGDLETIQKIGHLLKGASSNLRINALSDTLYQIQFCEDPKQLDRLIKDYWAHFLSFENQINLISN